MNFYEVLFVALLLISFVAFIAMIFGKLPYKGSIVFLIVVFSIFVFARSTKFKEISASFAGNTLRLVNDKYREIVEIDQRLTKISTKMTEALRLYVKERGRWGAAYMNLEEWDKTLKSLADLVIEDSTERNRVKAEINDFTKKMIKEKEQKEKIKQVK